MKVRNSCPSNWIVVVFIFGTIACSSINADDKKEKDSKDDAWVVDVEPGIKRYGKEPKFAEIGHSSGFDIAPDGETIAFAASGEVKFWNTESNKLSGKIEGARANLVQYSADGLRLYVVLYGNSDSIASVYNAITHELELKLKLKSGEGEEAFMTEVNVVETDEDGNTKIVPRKTLNFNVRAFAVSANDKRLVATDGNTIVLFDAESGEQLSRTKVDQYVQKLAFIEEGNQFVDSNGNIYSSDNAEKLDRLPKSVFPQWMQSLEVNPKNSNQLLTADWSKGVVLYDLEAKERTELELDSKPRQFLTTAFSGNGKLIAGSTYPNSQMGKKTKAVIFVWDAESGELKNQFEPATTQVAFLKFSATGDKLYSKGYNEFGLTEWDLGEAKAKAKVSGHKGPVYRMQFDRQGESILTASNESGAIFFDLESGKPGKRLSTQNPSHLVVDKDGRYFAAAASYNSLDIFDREKGKSRSVNVRTFRRPTVLNQFSAMLTGNQKHNQWENYAINNLCICEDNDHLLIACRGQYSCRFDKYELATGKSVERNKIEYKDLFDVKQSENNQVPYSNWQWQPRSLVISDSGELMAIINDDRDVIIFDANDGGVVQELEAVAGQYNSSLYFLDGGAKLMVAANRKITIWDTETGEQIGSDLAARVNVSTGQMAISGDQQKIALITNEKGLHAKIIDLETMKEEFSRKINGQYSGIAIDHDGRRLAVSRNNGQFEVWELSELKD